MLSHGRIVALLVSQKDALHSAQHTHTLANYKTDCTILQYAICNWQVLYPVSVLRQMLYVVVDQQGVFFLLSMELVPTIVKKY